MAEARQAKAKNIEARKKTMKERVQEILSSPTVNDELKRKLKYCQDEINKGRDSGLVDRRGQLIAEADRRGY